MFKSNKKKDIFIFFARWCLYFVALFFIFFAKWLKSEFDSPTFEQLLFHIDLDNVGLFDANIYQSFYEKCVVKAIRFSILLISSDYLIRAFYNYGLIGLFIKIKHVFKALLELKLLNKLIANLYRIQNSGIIIVFFIFSVGYFLYKASFHHYVKAQFGKDHIKNYYINPNDVNIVPAKQLKNLVLIYVESLETTYNNVALFNSNLISSLEDIKGISFDFRQVYGTHWTIAGIVSSQCGLPLKLVSFINEKDIINKTYNKQGEKIKTFLNKAVCLTDVLSNFSYKNVFMKGAHLSFSGTDNFLKNHHYNEFYGKAEWIKNGIAEKEMNDWGLYDDKLFKQAREKFKQLYNSEKLFNLTILTVDTHHPNGHISSECKKRGVNEFLGIVRCTSQQVAEFVKFVEDNDYLDNTNIVILGDHLSMSEGKIKKLEKADRSIFNKFVSKNRLFTNRNEIVHFDLFPSILEFLGFHIEGGKLALGSSVFSRDIEVDEKDRVTKMNKIAMSRSPFYSSLW